MAVSLLRATICLVCLFQGGQARGFTNIAKDMFCDTVKIKMLCRGRGNNGGDKPSETCTGPNCCAKSKCYSNLLPMVKCKGSRGPSKCVGASPPFTAGTCQCKHGSCSTSGTCAAGSGITGLFDDTAPVQEDLEEESDVNLVEEAPLLLALSGLVVGGAVVGLRVLRRAGPHDDMSIDDALIAQE